MQTHADATDMLMASGTLSICGEDPLNAQLQQITEHTMWMINRPR
jgi:hypothetical protein